LSNAPIPIYSKNAGEVRYVYYGATDSGRLLAVVLVERGEIIRVVTAYIGYQTLLKMLVHEGLRREARRA
jgi:hypothetical protein